jgi:hypothetical protein
MHLVTTTTVLQCMRLGNMHDCKRYPACQGVIYRTSIAGYRDDRYLTRGQYLFYPHNHHPITASVKSAIIVISDEWLLSGM